MTRTIEIIVTPQGETRLETRGFAGGSCRVASQFLEQALGAKVSDSPTAEAYASNAQQGIVRSGSSN